MSHRLVRRDPVTVVVLALLGTALVVTAGMASGWGATQPPARSGPVAGVALPAPPDQPTPPSTTPLPAAIDTASVELAAADDPAPPPAGPRAAGSWVATAAALTGVPPTAVKAYADATLLLAAEEPACGLGWTTVAAIGAVESGHGSFAGAVLLSDGRPSITIIGPALDGDGVAAIPATPDGTAWHGDAAWEHAVGPMQFLPGTWERWGADGDGDGRADPHDLHDAALAAARYLCAGSRDLTGADGWTAAVLSYNRSQEYLLTVHAEASRYGRLLQAGTSGP